MDREDETAALVRDFMLAFQSDNVPGVAALLECDAAALFFALHKTRVSDLTDDRGLAPLLVAAAEGNTAMVRLWVAE